MACGRSLFFLAGLVIGVLELVPAADAVCRNNIPNCANYDKNDICHSGKYPDWVKKNCNEFCGGCKRTTACKDNIDNCNAYEKSVCTEYKQWSDENCERTCKFCSGPKPPPVPPTPPTPSGGGSGVSDEDKRIIVDLINGYRSAVQPAASNMPKIYWDQRLADEGFKWTEKCVFQIPTGQKVAAYGDGWIGMVIGAGYGNWRSVVNGWAGPKKIFQYGKDPDSYLGPGGWVKIGTYTQLITNDAIRVGCAFSKCEGTKQKRFYGCNFVTTIKFKSPYDSGTRCSSCPNSCKDGLCDCGAKTCANNARLDVGTCSC